ncbi:lasso peptide biosynthesis B2 protein [Georgenia subflava]|uniref:Lasso peptide biosynthesis B2 protein n=1 Tax=Georgenia subflava TaxID=1622177 RepID=A0A6N7EM13_9MICO|nr:lasso peptide biosynthesis B2 protein [Georgenia subflava]MPV38113.1 lasso peptide biosynthesis B2 protein [Georgenia subflava]
MIIPVREYPAVAAALVVACAVEVGIRTMRLPRLARAVGAPLRQGAGDDAWSRSQPELGVHGRRQARAVRRVMRHWPFGDTCLRHALVTGHRLRRLHPELVVGVAKVDGEIKAHAWLAFDGTRLYDPLAAARSYVTLGPSPEDA